jgi:hypothetical protein
MPVAAFDRNRGVWSSRRQVPDVNQCAARIVVGAAKTEHGGGFAIQQALGTVPLLLRLFLGEIGPLLLVRILAGACVNSGAAMKCAWETPPFE